MGHLHNRTLSPQKENFILCDSMDGPGEHYAKQKKPGRERQIPYDFTHMWYLMNKLKWGQSYTWKAGWQLVVRGGEEVEGFSKKEKGFIDIDNSVVMARGMGQGREI